jgi:hypothetical protein
MTTVNACGWPRLHACYTKMFSRTVAAAGPRRHRIPLICCGRRSMQRWTGMGGRRCPAVTHQLFDRRDRAANRCGQPRLLLRGRERLSAGALAHVERPPPQRPHRADPLDLDRQGRAAPAAGRRRPRAHRHEVNDRLYGFYT